MPLPDLARPSRVEARMIMSKPQNAVAINVLTCPTDATIRLRTIYVSNQSANTTAFTLNIIRAGVIYPLIPGVTINAKSLFNVTAMDDAMYMEPGDILQFRQEYATGNLLILFVSYEAIT